MDIHWIELALEHPFLSMFYADGFRDLQVFEELFSFACPKFLSPVVPNYDNVHPNYHKEPFQQQLKVFAEEVQQQAQLSTIRRWVNFTLIVLYAYLARNFITHSVGLYIQVIFAGHDRGISFWQKY